MTSVVAFLPVTMPERSPNGSSVLLSPPPPGDIEILYPLFTGLSDVTLLTSLFQPLGIYQDRNWNKL